MQIELENLLAIGGILVAVVTSLFSFKDYIRDRFDDHQQKINDQNIAIIRLEGRVNALESVFKELRGDIVPRSADEQIPIQVVEQKKKEV